VQMVTLTHAHAFATACTTLPCRAVHWQHVCLCTLPFNKTSIGFSNHIYSNACIFPSSLCIDHSRNWVCGVCASPITYTFQPFLVDFFCNRHHDGVRP